MQPWSKYSAVFGLISFFPLTRSAPAERQPQTLTGNHPLEKLCSYTADTVHVSTISHYRVNPSVSLLCLGGKSPDRCFLGLWRMIDALIVHLVLKCQTPKGFPSLLFCLFHHFLSISRAEEGNGGLAAFQERVDQPTCITKQ